MRGVKDLFFVWLRRQHPELLRTYADLYAHGPRTPRPYRDLVPARANRRCSATGLPIPDATSSDKFTLVGRRSSVTEPTAPTLFWAAGTSHRPSARTRTCAGCKAPHRVQGVAADGNTVAAWGATTTACCSAVIAEQQAA